MDALYAAAFEQVRATDLTVSLPAPFDLDQLLKDEPDSLLSRFAAEPGAASRS